MNRQDIIEFSQSLNISSASLNEAQRIINFCLDLMNDIHEKETFKNFRNFNLRLSMDLFSYIIKENSNQIEDAYWKDSIKELKYDIDNFLRRIES